jgi:protein-tyrosine kinase
MSSPVIPIKDPMPSPEHRSSMGLIMLETGRLSLDDIEQVLLLQQQSGLRFGEAALNLGLVTVRDIEQVLARQFSYPYLTQRQGKYPLELVAAYQPFSKQAETLRAVRSQLMLHWFSANRKTLAIGAPRRGDGASLFAANLGIMFSQLGKQTLLVDANLRTPRQHKIFGLSGRRGLADILGQRSAMETIVKIDDFPDLSVLPAGTPAPNPQELVSRAGMVAMNETLCSRFEIILYDLPAFMSSADGLPVAACAGGALLVTRKDHTRLPELKACNEQLYRCNVKIVGSVLGRF